MKAIKHSIVILIGFLFTFSICAQDCEYYETWEGNMFEEPLQMSAPNGGYYTILGNPIFVNEDCTPGGGTPGLRIQAGVNGPGSGDVIGFTSGTPPTFTMGKTYRVAGKKLYSNTTMGDYENIVMTITLVNSGGAEEVINKTLMLIQGQCESWDPPVTFTASQDFDFAEIAITATALSGEDDLFIIIDDWCIEEVTSECFAEFGYDQIDECGGVQFFSNITGGTFDSWQISGPNGYTTSSDVENLNIDLPFAGTYIVEIAILCEDGSLQTFQQSITVDFFDEDPIFEACMDGSTEDIIGISVGGECITEYVIPDLLPFDDSGVYTVSCFLDSTTPVIAGQTVSLSGGTHQVFCNIVDECGNETSCLFFINVTCEGDGEPCDYECCVDGPNWPVEGYALGSLPQSNPTGYYPEYGDPQVVADGCDGSSQGIILNGVTLGYGGDAAGLRNNGTPPIPLFEMGKTYCITYCMKVIGGNTPSAQLNLLASNVAQTNSSCTGSCEPIGQSRLVNVTEGWVTVQNIYTASADYDNFILLNEDTGVLDFPSSILFDNVCITENPEPITCKVDLILEEQECGKVIVTTENCGEIESLVILWDDGFESFESEEGDTTACINYPNAGPWTVTVNYTCADGTTKTVSKTITLENKINAPVLTCPGDTIINLDPEGNCIADVLLGNYTVDDPSATVNCYVSGLLVSNPSIPVQIPVGVAQIQYIATNECGADTCTYEIEVTCEGKYDCPIDVLFVMDNSGSIDPTEYGQMSASALAEINAISSVYSNSRFGVLHYSGECGETITIEHDFQASASITAINRQYLRVPPIIMDDLNEALGATISALTNVPDTRIISGVLNPNSAADLYVVIFTDAAGFTSQVPTGGCTNSALKPYTNSNILKNSFGANISVVHFVPGYADDVAAAIASPGGNYTGTVDANAGDPTNTQLPRQFIPVPFGVPSIDLLDVLPPCSPCFDCDDLVLTSTLTNEEECCYSIDFNNGYGPDIVKMEAEVITPDWQFNTAATNPGSGFQWYPGTVTTGNKLCLTGSSNNIPAGPNPAILDYCFSPAVATPSGPQIVVFKYYTILNDSLFELQCTDTLTTDCTPIVNDPCVTVDDISFDCNPDNAYEYNVSLTVTNNSGFTASNVTLYGLNSGFQFSQCSSSAGVNSISIPVAGGLADGASTTICVKIIAPIPILNPTGICFNIGINSFTDCCHSPDEVCITLDPCCDPCEDILTTYTSITIPGEDQCCYSLHVDYECDYLYFNKIRFSSQTTGVTFGYHALGNPNFQMCGSSPTDLCIEPVTSPLAKGNYASVMDICFDGITDPSQIPQIVKVEYVTVDPSTNQDTVVCSDDLTFECDVVDNKCLEVSNQDLVCVPDSNKYRYTFDIKNIGSPAFTATDVDVFIISPTDLIFTPSGGTFPLVPNLSTGNSATITSCIESSTSTFPSTATSIVFGYRLRYNAGDTCCYESILDTIAIPPCDDVPEDCFTVIDIDVKNVVCDAPDCYGDPFCQAWLVGKINAYTCFPPSSAAMEKAIYNGRTVFLWKETYIDGAKVEIYECDGTLIQDCYTFFPSPPGCSLDAGIDITTDLTSLQTVWDCSMSQPTYDPAACIGAAINTTIDYCVKIMNNSPIGYTADQLNLNPILPSGVTISPTTHTQNIPSGGMATINFTVAGNLNPGDIVKVEGLLSGLDPMEMAWECSDTICLEVPPCPVDSCCTNEDEFLADIAQGFLVTQLGDCTYQVCANQFDTCHYFGTLGPDWGDGSVTLPAINQSNPPNNCWTYTYATSGTFKIAIHVYEGDPANNESCWDADLCATVETDCCDEDPCDDISVTTTSMSTTTDSCCTLFTIDNNFCEDYFKGIRVEVPAPASVSQISGMSGYVVNQITPQVAEVRPLFGFISTGIRDVFTLCTTGYTTNPHQVTVSWLVPDGNGGCTAECPSEHEIECDIDPPVPDKCYEFVADSTHCESNTYCFKIKNTSSPAFDINSVDLYDLSGTLGLSPTGRITIPTLTSGMTSDWICVNYFGVNPGDTPCFKISAHNTPAGLPPSTCCTDTIVTCFTVPECPMETCGTCPDGTAAGANQVNNGDFEQGTGYFGWSSGYNQELTGLMGSNEHSIRNSTNLVNTQWAAIDHTTGSTTGQFLAIDGPSGNVAYTTTVFVAPNTDYVFCMWVDNLVTTSITSNPIIEVKIGGQLVEAGRWLPKNPDGWQLITLTYSSGSSSGPVNIEVTDIGAFQYNDWAIDDVSFRECGPTVVDDCCDVTDQDIINYYNVNISNNIDGCNICVSIDIDSCDIFEFRYDNDPFIPYSGTFTECKSYTDPGPHNYDYKVTRLDTNGDTCYSGIFNNNFTLMCDTISDPDPCCDDLDQDALDTYYSNNINFDTTNCSVCVIADLDSCDVGTIIFLGSSPQPLLGNTQICNQYTASGVYSYLVDIVRYNIDGDTCYHYQSEEEFDIVCDVNPPTPPCVEIVADSIDCETNTYCFKIRNNTLPAWTIRSLAFVNETAGHSLSPDPVSISPLAVGGTSDWICVNYIAMSGDSVCFNLVAHQEDLGAGDEPQFCCSNPEPVCFVVPDCDQACCEDEEGFYDLLDMGWTVSQNGCSVTVSAPQLDSCHWLSQSEPDWGDGSVAGQVIVSATGMWSHTYDVGGSYTICATVFEGDNPEDACFSGEMCTEVELIDCPEPPVQCDAIGVTIYNAMTPNGDGLNDRLVVSGGADCTKNIKVYNRWGQEVWAQLNYQNDWTGQSFSGEQLPDGTYFLVLEFPDLTDDKLRMTQTYIELRN